MSQLALEPAPFSLLDVFRGMLRRVLVIISCLILGVLAGLAIVTVFEPEYESEARVIIENLATPYDQSSGVQPEVRGDFVNEFFVASQVAVLDSADLTNRVIRDLDLPGKGEFEPLANGVGTAKKVLISLGFSDDPRVMTPEQRAYRVLKANKTVYPVPESNVIAVRYTSGDGETAAKIANAIAETYVISTRERDSGATDRARSWLATQIQDLRKKVADSEAAVERYRSEAGLMQGQSSTLGTQEISELNSQITLAEAASSEARAKANEISKLLQTKGSVDGSSAVLASPVIQALRQQQVATQRKIADLSATYLPNHPKMKAAQRESDNVDTQIRREAIKIVDSLQGEADIAEARAEALRQNLEELKGREGVAAQSEVKLNELEREATANRSLLEAMLARFADASARQETALQPGYARVIQTAVAAPAPYFPKIGPTVMLTSFTGLGLGLGLAFLFEMMALASRFSGASAATREVEPRPKHALMRTAAEPVLVPDTAPTTEDFARVSNPFMSKPPPAPVAAMPQVVATIPSPATLSETFDLLHETKNGAGMAEPIARVSHAVTELRRKTQVKILCVTSVGGTQEAAMATIALARMLAQAGQKAIIIDATATRPSVIDLLSVPNGQGLAELVAGAVDFTKVVVRDPSSEVQIIRHGLKDDEATRNLIGARIEAILTALSSIFEVVLVHAGEASPQTPELVRGCKAALFVAPPSRHRDAVAAASTLAQRGVAHALFVKLETPQPEPLQASRLAG